MANKQIKILRRTSEFDRIRESGKAHCPTKWLLVAFRKNGLDDCRYGWTVSRRVGTAVTRNRLKRWCREFFRARDGSLAAALDINVIFKAKDIQFYRELKFSDFEKSMEKSWRHLEQVC